MARISLKDSKKVEWLQKNGTSDALDLLGIQVDELARKAVQNNLKFKETEQMEIENAGITNDPLAVGFLADDEPTATEQATPVVESKEVNDLEAVDQELHAQDAVSEPVAETEPKQKSVDEAKADEVHELVDAIAENLINPVIETMASIQSTIAEQQATIKSLSERVETLQKELQVQGLQIKEETIPAASSAALIKQYIAQKLNPTGEGSGTFGKSVDANDPILTKKPAEQKVKEFQPKSMFDGFLEGK